MLGNSETSPLDSGTKWYDCDEAPVSPQQHQSSLFKWINSFNSLPSEKSNGAGTSNAYRGVQGLRQFWNSQITATKDCKQKSATLSGACGNHSPSRQCKTPGRENIPNGTAPKRSKSFFEEHPDSHVNDDNFYKYRTASSSKKRLTLSSLSDLRQSNSFGVNFPLVAATPKGAKIHWARRDDIFANRKQKDSRNSEQQERISKCSTVEVTKTTTTTTASDRIAPALGENAFFISRKDNNATEISSPPSPSSRDKNGNMAIRSIDKRDSGRSNSGSTNSLSSESPVRKATNSTTRKYSFKTHSKNYYTPRKMTSGSKVAALTHRFNQLIQQDSALLEEVKRNNGVLISTSGHVYKIRETGETSRKKSNKGSGTDDEVSSNKGSSRKKHSFRKRTTTPTKQTRIAKDLPSRGARETTKQMTVKETIQKFETNTSRPSSQQFEVQTKSSGLQKPKVPSKSEYVLQRIQEVAQRNSLRKSKLSAGELRVSTTSKVLSEIQEEEKTATPDVTAKTEDQVPLPNRAQVAELSACSEDLQLPPNSNAPNDETFLLGGSLAEAKLTTPQSTPEEADNSSPSAIIEVPPISVESEVPSISSETEDSPVKKSTRIYEKFRFRALFPNKKSSPVLTPVDQSSAPLSPPDQKIVDALETVNKKLEHLSKSTSDICYVNEEERLYQQMTARMKPNDSFLFRKASRTNTNFIESPGEADSSEQLVQAVNTRLINKTQSMDETKFPSMQLRQISFEERDYTTIFQKTDVLLSTLKVSQEIVEELYEPIAPPTDTAKTEISHSAPEVLDRKVPAAVLSSSDTEDDNIYQTLTEVKNAINRKDCDSINSYESYANYESVEDDIPQPNIAENSYESCDPPDPPPPRKLEPDIRISDSDQLPALPDPKRIVLLKGGGLLPVPDSIDYTKIPPRPPKSPRLPDVPLCLQANFDSEDEIHLRHHHDDDDDDNIYDTIKQNEMITHCYESITSSSVKSQHHGHGGGMQKSLDTISMVSNCYESISSLRRVPILHHSDSISTLSSDQKTNSLYGMTLGQTITPPSEGVSDNSDDWVTDVSDDETQTQVIRSGRGCGAGGRIKEQFIVVRERAKYHRSPDWSKKVRDQRTHRQAEEIDDDSDHLYEPLYHLDENTVGETVETTPQYNTTNGIVMPGSNYTQHNNNSGNCYSDGYDDSFSEEETDEEVKKNDSGVDISNNRLPDPPTTTNHVYAFVKKIKNFGSLSKSLSKISMRKNIISPKTATENANKYENTQFYVPEYQNTNFGSGQKAAPTKQKTPKASKKGLRLPKIPPNDDPYENTEFHTPVTPKPQTPEAQSSPIIPQTPLPEQAASIVIAATSTDDALTVGRKKSKSGKSFKSKFRKSIAGTAESSSLSVPNAFNATRSTFYISDSIDVDSGIFEKTSPNSEPNLAMANNKESTEKISSTAMRKTKKSLSSPELNRRRTTIGIRPSIPPPPPPVDKKTSKQKHASTTSWYTECGVFKPTTLGDELMMKDAARTDRNSNTSWYADAGLYHTSGASVASSSGSSGVSTGGEGGPGDDNSHSMFLNEPLYQIYSAAKLQSISDISDQESTDGYEEIGPNRSSPQERKSKRPSAFQLIGPRQGPSRTLWSEIGEVQNSGILSTLTLQEKRLQEAKFEILTSEASYLKSLNLLKKHFMGHPAFRDTAIMSNKDRKSLFASILPVQECSDRLLCDLENCWQDNIMLLGLSKSISKHAEKYFHVYIAYCENQGKMDRTLRRLKEEKGTFNQHLEALENDPECCGLNLHSFLMLPMQRITRLPLLIDAVVSQLKADDDEYECWKLTLGILNKIVVQCNEAANRYEQAYEIERISRQIEFPSNIRSLAIAPVGIPAPGAKPRALVKKGELVQLIWRGDDGKLTFGKKFTKCNIFAFLFTDLLVLTKRKGDETFVVFDYCLRSMVTVSSGEVIPQLPTKEVAQAGKNLIFMTLLENYEGKTVELILSCPSISERQRWLEATKPPESEDPNETLYEQWDCPQVIVKHDFIASEPDMLSLQLGDVINVNRKMADGWYQGERIRDGATGWFPGNFTEEIISAHVRARNLKQRYRLLNAFYLESHRNKT